MNTHVKYSQRFQIKLRGVTNLLRLPTQVKVAGKPCDNTNIIPSPATPTTKEKSIGQKTVLLKRRNLSWRRNLVPGLLLALLVTVLLPCILFEANQNRVHGSSVPPASSHSPECSHSEDNREHAIPVGPSSIGETSAPSIQRLPQNLKQNDFIKDEYFEIHNSEHTESFTDDYYEYEQGQAEILIKGRLKLHISFWEYINASNFICETIQYGYKLPFFSTPPSVLLRNNCSAFKDPAFVSEAIKDLVVRGLAVECSNKPFVVNPLSVSVQNSGKKRLILDLRHVNCHLWKSSVKFEDIRIAMQFIEEKCYCFQFDIHSAYHHLDIFDPHTEFLGFSWEFEGNVKFFKFTVLPFGLSSACYIFTKLTRPLIKKWRSEGKQILMYLDDGLGTHSDENICYEISKQVKHDLIQSGFVPKPEKSLWLPTRQVIFLGYGIDTVNAVLKIPQQRIEKLRSSISSLLSDFSVHGRVFVRKVSSVVGQIISMSYVLGNIVYIMTKSLSIDIASAKSWNVCIKLSEESSVQLDFWNKSVQCFNEKKFSNDQSCQSIAFSDASNTGYGGYVVNTPVSVAHGMWTESEKKMSSTWRELFAVKHVLFSMLHIFEGKRVKWFTDNQNVEKIVNKGSMRLDLQEIAFSIFQLCLKHNISICIEWIPRNFNDRADLISRIIDFDDWGVSTFIFSYLDSVWGPHEIDWFASDYNNKLPVFYSRYWNMYSSGVDAFTADWFGVRGWFVPPVCIVHRVLLYMKQCCAYGTLIVPLWRSASFWPYLCPSGDGFISEVVGVICLPTNKDLYFPGKGNKSIFGKCDLPFHMIALNMDFRENNS